MRLRGLSKLALVAAAVAVAVSFAQAQKQPKGSERSEQASAASKSLHFNAAEVQGYLDEPSPVSVIDINEADQDPITLNRSFKEALKNNVDKESVERLTGTTK